MLKVTTGPIIRFFRFWMENRILVVQIFLLCIAENNQYPPTSYYSTPTQSVYSYSAPPITQPSREPEPGKPVYLSGNRPAIGGHQTGTITPFTRYETIHPLDHKNAYPEDKFYLRPASHVTVHGGAIPIQQPPQVNHLNSKYFFLISLNKYENLKIWRIRKISNFKKPNIWLAEYKSVKIQKYCEYCECKQ